MTAQVGCSPQVLVDGQVAPPQVAKLGQVEIALQVGLVPQVV